MSLNKLLVIRIAVLTVSVLLVTLFFFLLSQGKVSDRNVLQYITRSSGITAFVLLSTGVSFGLIQSTKILLKYRYISIPTAYNIHRTINWTGLMYVLVHISSIVFQKAGIKSLISVLIPFTYSRGTMNIYVAFGVIAFYLILLLLTTSELQKKIISNKTWRLIHYSSFICYLLFLVHGFLSGSDSSRIWLQLIYTSSLVSVTGLVGIRVFRK